MKKEIILIAAVLCIFLLVGCGQNVQNTQKAPSADTNSQISAPAQNTTAGNAQTAAATEDTITTPTTDSNANVDISKSDLDKLKNELDNMQFDDLDQLS